MIWHAESLWEQIAPELPGFTVEVLPQIDSTNSELMRRARAGQPYPTLLVAEQQTAGRGRLGRQWASDCSALTFSLGLPLAPADWSGLSLAVGLSLAESLHSHVAIKWPNDLWLDGRKLAGILVETAAMPGANSPERYVVVGVGINVAKTSAEGLRTAPAWLQELDPQATAATALARVALPLVRAVQAFAVHGFAPLAARFASRDALMGREVVFTDAEGERSGRAQGVAENGALLVHTAGRMHTLTSSEISVRPVAQEA